MVSPRRIELMARNFPHNVAVLGKEIPLRRKNIPPRAIQLRKEMPLVGTELTASDRDGTTWGGVRRLRGPWSYGPPLLSSLDARYGGLAESDGSITILPYSIIAHQTISSKIPNRYHKLCQVLDQDSGQHTGWKGVLREGSGKLWLGWRCVTPRIRRFPWTKVKISFSDLKK